MYSFCFPTVFELIKLIGIIKLLERVWATGCVYFVYIFWFYKVYKTFNLVISYHTHLEIHGYNTPNMLNWLSFSILSLLQISGNFIWHWLLCVWCSLDIVQSSLRHLKWPFDYLCRITSSSHVCRIAFWLPVYRFYIIE